MLLLYREKVDAQDDGSIKTQRRRGGLERHGESSDIQFHPDH